MIEAPFDRRSRPTSPASCDFVTRRLPLRRLGRVQLVRRAGIVLVAALAAAAAAHASSLPPPALRVPGYVSAMAAAGSRLALATAGGSTCALRLVDLARPA